MSSQIPLPMKETSSHYIFPKKVLFREMIQDYDGLLLRKDLEAIQHAKFKKNNVDLFDTHETGKENFIGNVRNIYLDQNKWRGDVYFQKNKLSNDQKHQLLTGEKRDLSIGYEYTLVLTPEIPNIDGDQTDILVDHVAWVDNGRCPLPYCGLDQNRFANRAQLQDQKNKRLRNHEEIKLDTPELEAKRMAECDEKDSRIRELEKKLEAKDSAEKSALTKKVDDLNDKLKTKDEAFKTEKEDLTSKLTVLQKTFDEKKVKLDKIEADEIVKLKKVILENSSFKEEDLKDKGLDKLKETFETIKKAKPTAIDGYPPGDDKTLGDDKKPKSNLESETNLRDLIVKKPDPPGANT